MRPQVAERDRAGRGAGPRLPRGVCQTLCAPAPRRGDPCYSPETSPLNVTLTLPERHPSRRPGPCSRRNASRIAHRDPDGGPRSHAMRNQAAIDHPPSRRHQAPSRHDRAWCREENPDVGPDGARPSVSEVRDAPSHRSRRGCARPPARVLQPPAWPPALAWRCQGSYCSSSYGSGGRGPDQRHFAS